MPPSQHLRRVERRKKVFRFKEQEKLHEEVIDTADWRRSTSHISTFREIAQAEQTDVKTTLLDGKPSRKSFNMCVKRTRGCSSSAESASTATKTWTSAATRKPTALRRLQYSGVNRKMFHPSIRRQSTPSPGRKKRCDAWSGFCICPRVAKTAIHRYAIEKGHTIISNTVVDAAVGHILPKGAMDAMRALGGNLDAAGN